MAEGITSFFDGIKGLFNRKRPDVEREVPTLDYNGLVDVLAQLRAGNIYAQRATFNTDDKAREGELGRSDDFFRQANRQMPFGNMNNALDLSEDAGLITRDQRFNIHDAWTGRKRGSEFDGSEELKKLQKEVDLRAAQLL